MNRWISYLFIALYASAVMGPSFPWVDYAVNYTFISEELCENKDMPEMHCNGKCYLAKQLKEAEQKKESNEYPNVEPVDLDAHEAFDSGIQMQIFIGYQDVSLKELQCKVLSGFDELNVPPPIV